MTNRLKRRTMSELKDYLGFMILCIPDMFPDDEYSSLGPKNMKEAFEDLFAAFSLVAAEEKQHESQLQALLPIAKEAERLGREGDYKGCSFGLQRILSELTQTRPRTSGTSDHVAARDESDSIMNEAIGLARQMIARDSSHTPFAKVLTNDGEIETILVDDTDVHDPTVLADALETAIRQRTDLQAVAFTMNVDYREVEGGQRVDAIIIDIDNKADRAIRCVLPYSRHTNGEVVFGEVFGQEAKRLFFSTRDKVSKVK